MSKIAVEASWEQELTPEVRRFAASSSPRRWRSRDLYYQKCCDLRGIKIPAILHLQNLLTGNHQIELTGADAMSHKAILRTLSSIVSGDPGRLRLMRIDLSADVPEISIDWFRTHVRIPRKRILEVFGKQSRTGEKLTNGLHYGGNRDLIRIYDKSAELTHKRKSSNFPFAVWGNASVPSTITRVERQLRGTSVPATLRQVRSLSSAADLNPFEQIQFEKPHQVPFGGGETVRNVLASRGLTDLLEEDGPQVARSILNRHSGGKSSRLIRSLGRPEEIRGPDLYAIYRCEVLAQLEAL